MDNLSIQKLKETVLEFLKDAKVKIVLFGSRARKEGSAASDVDIGIIPEGELDKRKVALLREFIEERLNIPYKVDVVDFSGVSEEFRKEALQGAVYWKS